MAFRALCRGAFHRCCSSSSSSNSSSLGALSLTLSSTLSPERAVTAQNAVWEVQLPQHQPMQLPQHHVFHTQQCQPGSTGMQQQQQQQQRNRHPVLQQQPQWQQHQQLWHQAQQQPHYLGTLQNHTWPTAALQVMTSVPLAAPPSILQQLVQSKCLQQSCTWQQQQQSWLQRPQPWQPVLLQQQSRGFVLMPRRVKYRKAHKSMGFNETRCSNTRQLAFGLYGIRALEHCRIPAATLEAVRRTLRRTIKKTTMLWIRVTPNVPVTSKPAEVRMGKGKGTLDYWAAPIRPGQIIFEMDRCSKATALAGVKAIKSKMPIPIDFVEWN